MFYLANTPFWLRMIFPKDVVWKGDATGNRVYLTFDDGPTPEVTQFVLDQLRHYDYKATFFCIGDNVAQHPSIFQQLTDEGHRVGNHTMHHANGWKTATGDYLHEIIEANQLIQSNLFRPPYGKITAAQAKKLREATHQNFQNNYHSDLTKQIANPTNQTRPNGSRAGRALQKSHQQIQIIMWSVITGDFDTAINGNICFKRVKQYTKPGSIIVFHDSEKAFPRLKVGLPKTLAWIKEQGLVPVIIP
jgi:peptidoglycan/xylan/chitin deacetylase (PgdA/CDA1 family)